jgi:hypothetical protein
MHILSQISWKWGVFLLATGILLRPIAASIARTVFNAMLPPPGQRTPDNVIVAVVNGPPCPLWVVAIRWAGNILIILSLASLATHLFHRIIG